MAGIGAKTSTSSVGAATSLASPSIATQASGSTILVNVGTATAGSTSNVPTDNFGNTYVSTNPQYTLNWGGVVATYRAENASGGAGHVVTGSWNGAAGQMEIYVVECTSVATSSALDQIAPWTSRAVSPYSTNITGVSSSNGLSIVIASLDNSANSVFTWNGGYTEIVSDGRSSGAIAGGFAFIQITSATTQQMTFSATNGINGNNMILTLKQAAAGGGGGGVSQPVLIYGDLNGLGSPGRFFKDIS